jgi:hypothetical protein
MATKTFYATRDLKNPSYGTRMLKAGDPVELDGPKSRLYLALGAVTPDKPKALKGSGGLHEALTGETPTAPTGLAAALPAAKPAAKKAAPRKRTTKKRATAKK